LLFETDKYAETPGVANRGNRRCRVSGQFDEIKITGLDSKRTQPSTKAPGLRHMYLSLSASPPHEWVQLFEQQRQFPRHSMWRRAWIEGRFIVVDCVPEEIERYHVHDLKEDVAACNKGYLEWRTRVAAASANKAEEEQKERERLDELASRLKFD
jgi:hypothetical protein